jgi:hypothetical protein
MNLDVDQIIKEHEDRERRLAKLADVVEAQELTDAELEYLWAVVMKRRRTGGADRAVASQSRQKRATTTPRKRVSQKPKSNAKGGRRVTAKRRGSGGSDAARVSYVDLAKQFVLGQPAGVTTMDVAKAIGQSVKGADGSLRYVAKNTKTIERRGRLWYANARIRGRKPAKKATSTEGKSRGGAAPLNGVAHQAGGGA